MTSIALHIEYLLLRNDCVIIPGLGAFVAEYVAASINEANGEILPPMRKIGFNPAIRHNDGMLLSSIARKEEVTTEKAQSLLDGQICNIDFSLNTLGEFSIGNLGRLIKNEDSHSVEFIPRLSAEKRAATGGNPAARLFEVIEPPETATEANTPTDCIEEFSNPVSQDVNQLPPHTYLKLLSDKNYYIAINKIFARCAAAFIVIAAIAVSFIVPPSYTTNNEVKASLNPVESLTSKSANTAHIDSDWSSGNVADPEREDSNAASESELIEIEESPEGYYLIVATFKNQAEASSFIEQRRGGDYPLQILTGKSLWRVSAGHGDYSTLRTILNSSEFRAAFSEAWIWNVGPTSSTHN